MLIPVRAVAVAVAPQVTTSLAGTRPHVKVSEISRSRAHDRSVEIYHCPIRTRISPDDAVRIVACGATVAIVVAVR